MRNILAALVFAIATVGCAATSWADPPDGNWRLIHADEFSGTSIDPVKWATQYQ